MNTTDIENLIEKYLEGDTSLEEEQKLRNYFLEEEVPKHLVALKAQFLYYNNAAEEYIETPDFEERLMKSLDEENTSDSHEAKTIKLETKRKSMWYSISAVAATIVIVIAAYFFIYDDEPALQNTYDNPEAAYETTRAALFYVSQKMNLGVKHCSEVSKINESVNKVFKDKQSQGDL